jgi:hypothetical protein
LNNACGVEANAARRRKNRAVASNAEIGREQGKPGASFMGYPGWQHALELDKGTRRSNVPAFLSAKRRTRVNWS